MRILQVNNLYPPFVVGGAEMSVNDVSIALAAAGHDTHILTLDPNGRTGSETLDGCTVHRIGLWNLYWPWSQAGGAKRPELRPLWHLLDMNNPVMSRRFARAVRALRPDVIHTNNLVGFTVDVWRKAHKLGIPIVHTLFDHNLRCPRTTAFRNGRLCAPKCMSCRAISTPKRLASDLVSAVCAVSGNILDSHLADGYFAATPIREIIYQGAEPCSACVTTVKARPARAAKGPLKLGFLGRLLPIKGLELLLSSLPYDAEDAWTLDIAGTGEPEYEAALRSQTSDRRVRFRGWLGSDELLHEVDLLVVPSLWHEPGPRVIQEAYRHGRPVIASNRGGCPEQIVEGKTGFVFDPDEPQSLATLLRRAVAGELLNDAMPADCLAAGKKVADDMSIQRYEEIYQRVAR